MNDNIPKRLSVLLLCFVLLIGLLPVPASAAGGTVIDLSQNQYINIIDNGTYILTGSGRQEVNISGSPTIILSNASINALGGNAINIISGSPTIKVEGKSEVASGYGTGIFVPEYSTVYITADDRSSELTVRAGRDGCGIGGYYLGTSYSVNCGNIHISNVTVYAYADANKISSPGIGSAGGASCGTITIDNATVHAFGTESDDAQASPGIGSRYPLSGTPSSIPQVNILHNSEVYAHRGGSTAGYIGWAGSEQQPADSEIDTGGGRITNSAVYMYTGNTTTTDKDKDYTEKDETPFPIAIISAGADKTAPVGYSTAEAPTVYVNAQTVPEHSGKPIHYQWYKDSVSYQNAISGATSDSYTVETGLKAGTYTYKCVVSCDGYTLASEAITVSIINPTPLPAPAGLSFYSAAPGSATATWSEVASASGYSVQLYKDGAAYHAPVTVTGSTKHTFSITETGSYTFTVRANGAGIYSDSPESAHSSALPFYQVDFYTDSGSTVDPQIVASGKTATEPATPTRTGYDFCGWYCDSSFDAQSAWSFSDDPVNGPTRLYAKWEPSTYAVDLRTDGGIILSGNVTEYTYGVGAALPSNVVREGYTFAGWYARSDYTGGEITQIGVTDIGDKVYYAKWLSNNAGVTAVSVNQIAGTISGSTITVVLPVGTATLPVDSSAVAVTPADNASVTAGPSTHDGGATWSFTVTAEDGLTTATYTVNVSIAPDPAAGNKADIAAAKSAIENRAWVVPQSTANTERAVKAWIEHELAQMNLNGVSYIVTMAGFAQATEGDDANRSGTNGSFSFTVTLSKGEDTGDAATGTFAEGTAAVTNGEISATPYTRWTVTANAGIGGTVSGGGTYEENTAVTVTATPDNGYQFMRWEENGAQVSTDAAYTFILTTDRTLTAVFERTATDDDASGDTDSDAGEDSGSGTGDDTGSGAGDNPDGGTGDNPDGDTGDNPDGGNGGSIGGSTGGAGGSAGGGIAGSAGGGGAPTYRPGIEQSEGGNISITPSSPVCGDTVTIIPTPDKGYIVGSITVIGQDGNEVPVAGSDNGSWSFIQPDGSVTIEVIFMEELTTPPFIDVPVGSWFERAAHYVYENGLMMGTSPITFSPDESTSRAMIVTILWRMEDRPTADSNMPYTDVAEGQWYTEAIRWAASEGIVNGYGDGSFGSDDPITREQLAAILYRYAQYKGYDVRIGENTNILSYLDFGQINEYAIPAMQWACGTDIISGTSTSTLEPQEGATRAQTATILMRFLSLMPF